MFGSFVGVDALCINQENLKERSHQVQRIGLIYENAFQVIVWFGKIYYEPKTPKDASSWWECAVDACARSFHEFARSSTNGEVEQVF